MVTVTGKVLRILPLQGASDGETSEQVVDLILANTRQYWRISLWDDKPALVARGALKLGDVVCIDNASVARAKGGGERRLNAGSNARITKVATSIEPLSDVPGTKLTVLAVARPEGNKVCIAGANEQGEWIRPQGVYAEELFGAKRPLFKNLCVSTIYLDAWRGRRARKEDRFFICSRGVERALSAEEKRTFLEQQVDASVDTIFKNGRSLGLIRPRILRVYEERVRSAQRKKGYEQYIRFNFKDRTGRVYRHWSCRCAAFYNAWNALKAEHQWICGWRMLRYLQRTETYLAIGLTYSDYGVDWLEYGAYPMIVGVHIIDHHAQPC